MASGFVGIVGYRVGVVEDPHDGAEVPNIGVTEAYVKAVLRAGRRPVVVPPVDPVDAADLVRDLEAVVLVGGTDVDPAQYGATRSARTMDPDQERDAAEIAICRAAVAANRPLLAICRGMQVLNVALGGTLVQHIDHHRRADLYNQEVHEVKVDAGTRLAHLLGVEERSGTFTLGTNSMHHQCVDLLGDGVRAVAWAADGTIEGIEVDGAPNVVGVQWHPETLRHLPAHLGLFRSI
jgi:putative glutamine amidotransferase